MGRLLELMHKRSGQAKIQIRTNSIGITELGHRAERGSDFKRGQLGWRGANTGGRKENFTCCPLAFHDFHGATGVGRGALHLAHHPLTEGDGLGIIAEFDVPERFGLDSAVMQDVAIVWHGTVLIILGGRHEFIMGIRQ
jgi:hypothetical protein